MIQKYKDKIEQLKGEKKGIVKNLSVSNKKSRSLRRELSVAQKAQALIQVVAQNTQEQLKYHLSELPKLALSSVFDDPYDFEVEINIKRSKTEVEFYFVRDGARIAPKENTGLGAVDIAGMALRPALWSLKQPRNRPMIWLDEPFKHLKGADANRRALAVLKEITMPRPEQGWPGMQIIMIADERASKEDIAEVADKLFLTKMRGRKTFIEEIECNELQ